MKSQKGFTLIELLVVIAIVGILAAITLSAFGNKAHAASCGGWFEPSCESATNQQRNEQETVTAQINRLTNTTPVPSLDSSLERENISKRLTTFSDPAKISYIYLINYGHVMSYYVVKGKITSGNKRLTANQRLVDTQWSAPDVVVMDSPELDGTYGASSPYIFFWTTDGTYVQWSGDYMLTDQPLKLTNQPELIRNVQ